ncbi:rhodanese-like domain-containing protein [Fuchsiella alkaliacetigena]|uniref:rhodanese-like domain-containing protein n=1 Tax=Fuchsiella alkaliacetigena TaxID=957042 RepID=UPI00200A756F|nr:rhodanese-like domain-containing protein [Fuchsiella alkaliacetigena]MCK8825813.1 rhodanese-like domain-containing protein [Fuchsiella alkaliacetigena]
MLKKLGKIGLLLIVACSIFALFILVSNNDYRDIDVFKAQEMIVEEEVLIIDVREAYEFESGHISGAELMPLAELKKDYQQLDSEQKILLVCRSGNRSGQAGNFLAKRGFSKVYNLSGGMIAWERVKSPSF